MILYLKSRYIKQDLTKTWSIDTRKKIIFINSKLQKIYNNIFAKLILGFSL